MLISCLARPENWGNRFLRNVTSFSLVHMTLFIVRLDSSSKNTVLFILIVRVLKSKLGNKILQNWSPLDFINNVIWWFSSVDPKCCFYPQLQTFIRKVSSSGIWRRVVRWVATDVHGVISQKMILFITTAVKTSNPTFIIKIYMLAYIFSCILMFSLGNKTKINASCVSVYYRLQLSDLKPQFKCILPIISYNFTLYELLFFWRKKYIKFFHFRKGILCL
jgi:hypothetical protein